MSETTPRVRLYLIRHAQSAANTNFEIICGRNIHNPLSPLGNEQSALLGKRLKYEKIRFDSIICSTAVRAKQTADIALKFLDVDPSTYIMSSALLEQSQGAWEGLHRAVTYDAKALQRMAELHVEFSAPEGESIRMVQKRVNDFLEPHIEKAKKQSIAENRDISIGVFTHANLIRAMLQHYLQSTPEHAWLIDQRNTAINEITFNRHGTCLVKTNDTGHLIFPVPETSDRPS